MKNQVFHIAGGGIAGLASAIAVANAGGSAMVMEKAAQFETVGAGLQLGPNAVRALQKLGAWDAVEPSTVSPPEIHVRNGVNGKMLQRIKLGQNFETRFGMPYRAAHRADLLQALLNVVKSKPNITVQANAEVIGRDTFDGFALIAADGVWSPTRAALFPNHAAIASNDVIYRSLFPLAKLPNGIAEECINLWFYPGSHVVHYPVGHPNQLNLVAVTQGEDVETHFQNASTELREVLATAPNWSKWTAAYVKPLPRWNKGNVTLIGDAAHGTLPYLAQGAAMALEDAAILGAVLSTKQTPDAAFQLMCETRLQRTRSLHRSTLKAGNIYHFSGLRAAIRNAVLQTTPSSMQLPRLKWIYNWK
jgi:salicylate hydroxylase